MPVTDKRRRVAEKVYALSVAMGGSIGDALKEVSLRPPANSVYAMSDWVLEKRLDAAIKEWEQDDAAR